MKVKTKVKLTLNNDLIDRIEVKCAHTALELTAEWLLGEVATAGVVPKNTGMLEESGFYTFVHDKLVSVCYSGPQARRLYYNPQFNFRTDKNSNARGRWLDDWIYGDKQQDVINAFQAFYKAEIAKVTK